MLVEHFRGAIVSGIQETLHLNSYSEHAIGTGANASAVAYVEMVNPAGRKFWGVGVNPNIVAASLRAVISAFNQSRS